MLEWFIYRLEERNAQGVVYEVENKKKNEQEYSNRSHQLIVK